MPQGKYLVIEGAAGTGKSTLMQRLAEELQATGTTVRVLEGFDIYSDVTVQTLYRVMNDTRYPKVTETNVLLQHATDAQALQSIRASLQAGVTCLVDRSYLALLVEQYYGKGEVRDYAFLNELVDFAARTLEPDLLLVLDAPVHALKTSGAQSGDDTTLERLRAGYLWEAKQRELPVVHATEDAEALFTNVWRQVAPVISSRVKSPTTEPQSLAAVLASNPPTRAASVEPPVITPFVGKAPAGATATTFTSSFLVATQAPGVSLKTDRHPNEKDAQGHYRFYIPDSLKGKLRTQYIKTTNQLFDAYGALVGEVIQQLRTTSTPPKKSRAAAWEKGLETQAQVITRVALPLAALQEVIVSNPEHVGHVLLQSPLPEAQAVGVHLFPQAQDSKLPQRAQGVEKLAQELLAATHTATSDMVSLVSYTPHNELDVISDILYSHSDLPLSAVRTQAFAIPYQRKVDVLQQGAYTVLDQLRYQFDVVCSSLDLLELQQHFELSELQCQLLTPRLGYDTPELVESAELGDAFDTSFETSLQLYSTLQGTLSPIELQYTTLGGHKLRCNFTVTALQLSNFFAAKLQNALARALYDKIAAVHPLVAEVIKSGGR